MTRDPCAEVGRMHLTPADRDTTGLESQRGAVAGIVRGRLTNGLDVIVIPDQRSSIVTHMIWYRNGSSDDPIGKSGIAHFLEHLMFKGTTMHPAGTFSARLADVGGEENAFTSNDFTAYFQRAPREYLSACMAYEADRMRHLLLADDVVASERNVVLEERRMRVDADPTQILAEAMQAALYTTHPYGKPIIGWENEIESLDCKDAFEYYERFYTPENAILIVAGHVDPATVSELAEKHYGPIAPLGTAPRRRRPKEPSQTTHRLVSLVDGKVEQARFQRMHVVPSYTTAARGEAEALEVLSVLLGGGPSSVLTRALVSQDRIAVNVAASYMGTALDETRFVLHATPSAGVTLDRLDQAVEGVIARLAVEGFDDVDVARAKTCLVAEAIYARDSQMSLAFWYGAALTTGMQPEDVGAWPERIDDVTSDGVRKALAYLDRQRGVTGHLQKIHRRGTDPSLGQ